MAVSGHAHEEFGTSGPQELERTNERGSGTDAPAQTLAMERLTRVLAALDPNSDAAEDIRGVMEQLTGWCAPHVSLR